MIASAATEVFAARAFNSVTDAVAPFTVNLYAFIVKSVKAASNFAAVSAAIVAVTTPVPLLSAI